VITPSQVQHESSTSSSGLFVRVVRKLFVCGVYQRCWERTGRPANRRARGPVHEAYAQPWQANPGPNTLIDKKPPEPIPEEPAAEKPAGKNMQWIPGYWQWDQERKDFVWVSGLWRQVPDGRHWVMGYWANAQEGWRWVSGHWAAAQEKDHQYIPDPPANPDQGPTTTPPDSDSFYIPGT
jgi:WXXGXW repeat (2 copies)